MNKSVVELLKDGQQYMKTWPARKELYALFPDSRVVKATQFAAKIMPIVAVVSFCIQVQVLGFDFAPQAMAIALLMLSMPLQGYFWLGHRANQVMPIALQSWYRELESKLAIEGIEVRSSAPKPRYFELAYLLNKAFKKLDTGFTKEYL